MTGHLYFLQETLKKCHLQNMVIDPNDAVDNNLDKGLRTILGAKTIILPLKIFSLPLKKKLFIALLTFIYAVISFLKFLF